MAQANDTRPLQAAAASDAPALVLQGRARFDVWTNQGNCSTLRMMAGIHAKYPPSSTLVNYLMNLAQWTDKDAILYYLSHVSFDRVKLIHAAFVDCLTQEKRLVRAVEIRECKEHLESLYPSLVPVVTQSVSPASPKFAELIQAFIFRPRDESGGQMVVYEFNDKCCVDVKQLMTLAQVDPDEYLYQLQQNCTERFDSRLSGATSFVPLVHDFILCTLLLNLN